MERKALFFDKKIIKSGIRLDDATGITFTETNLVNEVTPEFFEYTRNKIEHGSGRYQNGSLILIKDDDLTPTIDVARGKADLLIGVGGTPEALISAIIIQCLGGWMTLRILPYDVSQKGVDAARVANWNKFSRKELDRFKRFGFVLPGEDKPDNFSGYLDEVFTHDTLAPGKDLLFTAAVVKDLDVEGWGLPAPYDKIILGVNRPDVEGKVTTRIICIDSSGEAKILTVKYQTRIPFYKEKVSLLKGREREALIMLALELAEYGQIEESLTAVKDALKAKSLAGLSDKVCHSVEYYLLGLQDLSQPAEGIKEWIPFKGAINLLRGSFKRDPDDTFHLSPLRMVKRYYEDAADGYARTGNIKKAQKHYQKILQGLDPDNLDIMDKLWNLRLAQAVDEYFNSADIPEYKGKTGWEILSAVFVKYGLQDIKEGKPWFNLCAKTVWYMENPAALADKSLSLKEIRYILNKGPRRDILNLGFSRLEARLILGHRKTGFSTLRDLLDIKGLRPEMVEKLLNPPVRDIRLVQLKASHIPTTRTTEESLRYQVKLYEKEMKERVIDPGRQERYHDLNRVYVCMAIKANDLGHPGTAEKFFSAAIHYLKQAFCHGLGAGYFGFNVLQEIAKLYETMGMVLDEPEYFRLAIAEYRKLSDEVIVDRIIFRYKESGSHTQKILEQKAGRQIEDLEKKSPLWRSALDPAARPGGRFLRLLRRRLRKYRASCLGWRHLSIAITRWKFLEKDTGA